MASTQRILDGAKALFMRYGVKSVTMDDISRDLGISKKTLYQVVDNKADLIRKIFFRFIKCEKDEMESIHARSTNAVEEIWNIGQYLTQLLSKIQPKTLYDLQKYYRESWTLIETLHKQHVSEMIQKNLKRGMNEGLYREELEAEIIAKLYVGKAFLITDEEMFPAREFERRKLVNTFFLYHMHGVVSPKGLKVLQSYISKN